MKTFKLYGFSPSGNCNKVRYVADYLGLDYQWIETDSPNGETRTPEFLATINPAGQVPAVVFTDGRKMAQSNAIMFYLATGSKLIPDDDFALSQMLSWMFWEQYSHEPYLAVRRAMLKFKGKKEDELDPSLLDNGNAALAIMEQELTDKDWFIAGTISLADIALLAYTRTADEGGFALQLYPNVQKWIVRTKTALGI
ncbi:MAG: glutathione S-transferase family protein [Robiginitomaculum sp.]|nr:glutathione S-transferase family protein [Robiginitomaculum sp.]